MLSALVILVEAGRRVYRVLAKGIYTVQGQTILKTDPGFQPPDYGEA
jgi:hypothetical protein